MGYIPKDSPDQLPIKFLALIQNTAQLPIIADQLIGIDRQ